ncbi:FMN-binding protein [Kitasatospora sp. MMS16-BH015]|uniref:FMN-binding protein n=1 Tax=Kitasatospora sp. MMS16-BH015 TaxID=2018025 RepID=UPI000CA1BC84|nr:FMN-binding protein [Kitasatospora sp. MMS16-BH015]AUG80070.1 FMN-binding protein [Kitasatospora sp. MMS16-BH015]
MRRAVVTTSATAAGIVLLLSLKQTGGAGSTGSTAKVISTGTGPVQAAAPSTGTSPSASPTTAGGSRTVTGEAVDTRYGPVQVRVTLDNSRISKIDVIQYPDESRRDQEINTFALPELNQEALAAQSAQIDAVSGATFTSDGYTRSLQSALDQAGRK